MVIEVVDIGGQILDEARFAAAPFLLRRRALVALGEPRPPGVGSAVLPLDRSYPIALQDNLFGRREERWDRLALPLVVSVGIAVHRYGISVFVLGNTAGRLSLLLSVHRHPALWRALPVSACLPFC